MCCVQQCFPQSLTTRNTSKRHPENSPEYSEFFYLYGSQTGVQAGDVGQTLLRYQNNTIQAMYKRIARALHDTCETFGRDTRHPQARPAHVLEKKMCCSCCA